MTVFFSRKLRLEVGELTMPMRFKMELAKIFNTDGDVKIKAKEQKEGTQEVPEIELKDLMDLKRKSR